MRLYDSKSISEEHSPDEIPPGYKKTEVGIIPEDWEVKQLGSFAHIRSRRVIPASVDPETICIELEHIGQGNGRLCAYSKAAESDSSKFLFFSGDVLFGRLRPYLKKFWFAKQNGICSTEIWPLTVDTSYILNKFLFYVVQTEQFLEAAEVSYGTHMPRADWKVLRELQIAIPPFSQQRAISEALSDVENLIESFDNLISKKQAIKKATMQQLLTGRAHLPGFEGEWEIKKMVDVSECRSGGTPDTSIKEYYGGEIPWVSISDMTFSGKWLKTTERTLTNKGLSSSAAIIFPRMTVLYAMYASIGECCIAEVSLCSSQAILGIQTTSKLDPEYLYYFLSMQKENVKIMAQHGTQPNLNAQIIKDFEIPIPCYSEQLAIVSVLSDLDDEIAELERRKNKVKQIKKGMMQQLLTGRIRLLNREAV
ncbi:MAG TPA: restriction endonuclease subunit S [Mesotoga infera]|nr:restriction endonuclease subunit S [Mesotoga infera]HRV03028.1 restriction endonuclease subunit S [Mesotoga sp.]